MNIDKNLVVVDLEVSSNEEALKVLAEKLFQRGYVKESFGEAILEREKTFPTALDFGEASIAIPHTDVIHVEKPGVCIARLKKPVLFNSMENPANELPVRLVFMLAIKEAHAHLEFLQMLIEKFQNEGVLTTLLNVEQESFLASLESTF